MKDVRVFIETTVEPGRVPQGIYYMDGKWMKEISLTNLMIEFLKNLNDHPKQGLFDAWNNNLLSNEELCNKFLTEKQII